MSVLILTSTNSKQNNLSTHAMSFHLLYLLKLQKMVFYLKECFAKRITIKDNVVNLIEFNDSSFGLLKSLQSKRFINNTIITQI